MDAWLIALILVVVALWLLAVGSAGTLLMLYGRLRFWRHPASPRRSADRSDQRGPPAGRKPRRAA